MNGSNKPAHVLMLVENAPYPKDVRVRREAEALHCAGYDVSVIAAAEPGELRREVLDGVHVYRYPAPRAGEGLLGYAWEYGYSMTAAFLLAAWLFLMHPFQVIHAANPPDTFVLVAAAFRAFGVKFIYDHHDLAPEMYYARFEEHANRFLYVVLKWLEAASCRLADHVIATNESYKQIEMSRGGVSANRITVVRNGPELQFFQPCPPDPELRNKAPIIIGYAGVTGTQDGVDCLLRALGHLKHDLRRTDWFCVIVGDGAALPGLKTTAEELGIASDIEFTGWIANRRDYVRHLCTMDICASPEPSNPYNNRSTIVKLAEYMALSRAIVAFDLPEHRRTAGNAAVYVPGNDENAFARAIFELMDDPQRREQLGAIARRRVETELAWQYSVPPLLSVYEAVIKPQAKITVAEAEGAGK